MASGMKLAVKLSSNAMPRETSADGSRKAAAALGVYSSVRFAQRCVGGFALLAAAADAPAVASVAVPFVDSVVFAAATVAVAFAFSLVDSIVFDAALSVSVAVGVSLMDSVELDAAVSLVEAAFDATVVVVVVVVVVVDVAVVDSLVALLMVFFPDDDDDCFCLAGTRRDCTNLDLCCCCHSRTAT